MANQPHDKTGRVCKCGYEFTAKSMTLTISHLKLGGIIRKELVCMDCHNKHYSRGE